MKIIKKVNVPTGDIFTALGEKGVPLEFLTIGDYGKKKNVKADFLGLCDEINGVEHEDPLPLEEKWVTTISTQYGCSMGCSFCDVPKVGAGINVTFNDLINQVKHCVDYHSEVKNTLRFNLHYARMGEPTFNDNIFQATMYLKGYFDSKGFPFHPVISTMMPKNNHNLFPFIKRWMRYKNEIAKGEAGLQISINTTDNDIRKKQFNENAMSIQNMYHFFVDMFQYEEEPIIGRKIALNIALTDAPVSANILRCNFNPKYFMVKITPMHMTNSCVKNGLVTRGGYSDYYPYKKVEDDLKAAGFDVLVFIPSKEEDESRITCGNAILSDR